MGARGPRPLPGNVHYMRGNPGKHDLPPREEPPEQPVAPPDYLDEEGRKEWDRVSKILHPAGLLTEKDAQHLALYCQAWSRYRDAQKGLAKTGLLVKAPSGYPIQSPYLSILNRAQDDMIRLGAEFGMTPSSRVRLTGKKTSAKTSSAEAKRQRYFGNTRA